MGTKEDKIASLAAELAADLNANQLASFTPIDAEDSFSGNVETKSASFVDSTGNIVWTISKAETLT